MRERKREHRSFLNFGLAKSPFYSYLPRTLRKIYILPKKKNPKKKNISVYLSLPQLLILFLLPWSLYTLFVTFFLFFSRSHICAKLNILPFFLSACKFCFFNLSIGFWVVGLNGQCIWVLYSFSSQLEKEDSTSNRDFRIWVSLPRGILHEGILFQQHHWRRRQACFWCFLFWISGTQVCFIFFFFFKFILYFGDWSLILQFLMQMEWIS